MAYKPEIEESEVKSVVNKSNNTTTTSVKTETDLQNKELRIKLTNPTKIEFIICNTGERNSRILHEPKFILTKNTLFKIPLKDSTINYKNINIIKLYSPYTENFRILDIVNGIATIEPILHGATIEHDAVIGMVY
jgi:hypothetical protein